jgi:hypothetical protein
VAGLALPCLFLSVELFLTPEILRGLLLVHLPLLIVLICVIRGDLVDRILRWTLPHHLMARRRDIPHPAVLAVHVILVRLAAERGVVRQTTVGVLVERKVARLALLRDTRAGAGAGG